MSKNCKHCGKEFDPGSPKAEFCQTRCRVEWHRKQAREGQPVATPVEGAPINLTTVHTRIRVRLWPADMTPEEVKERLYRMRDYNKSMRAQGTPQYCSTPEYVLDRLAEAGAPRSLLKIVFPEGLKPPPAKVPAVIEDL